MERTGGYERTVELLDASEAANSLLGADGPRGGGAAAEPQGPVAPMGPTGPEDAPQHARAPRRAKPHLINY
jgi:hypothetical protein